MTDARTSAMTLMLVIAIGLSPCARAQTSGAEVLTLDQAIQLARSNNRNLKQSGLDVNKQREALGEARTELYPRLDTSVLAAQLLTPIDFTIKAGQLGTYPSTGPVPASNTDLHTPARPIAIASVTLTQPLTQLFRLHLFVSEQRLKVDAAQLSLNESGQKLTDDVRQAYYDVLQSQSQQESQESTVKYLEELQQLTERRFGQRAALEADKLSVKAELAKAVYQLTTIEDSLADRKEALNHLLGRDLETAFSAETIPSTLPEEQDLTAARAIALEDRPEMKEAANRTKQASLETKIEKTHYIPDISIQASYMTLIIALGLLVDVPVVAGDGIKRGLAAGLPRAVAAWLGPTKLATAIFFATLTNIIAYLPFLMLTGNTGEFLRSLPIVMTAALLCALVVAMTFVPLLGYYIQRPPKTKGPTVEEKRERGFYGFYNRLVGRAIRYRWLVLAGSFVFLLIGGFVASHLKQQFFPEDVQYWFYLDIWLPNDVPLTTTNDAAVKAEQVVRQVVERSAKSVSNEEPGKHLLTSITSFIGGGGPRFWFSISPEAPQTSYAQVIVQVSDKEATPKLIGPLQAALNDQVPGAWITVRQLQTNPVETPVELLITGQADTDPRTELQDVQTLRTLASQAMDIVRESPGVAVLRDDWGPDSLQVRMDIDPDRANLVGITNADVANSSAAAISGAPVGTFKEGDKSIPIVARLRPQDRAQLSQIKSLYVYSSQQNTRVPLLSVATVTNTIETDRIRRREHFRTISILCFPAPGVLASEVLGPIQSKLKVLQSQLPPGYQLQIGGEKAKQDDGFLNLAVVLLISLVGIYLALLIQFKNAVKPLLVFAAAPYGAMGALIALAIMGTPFGFMAFLGVASLIGVIVSHVIVLFDFIEEMHEKGEPLERALPDAGIERIRPVMITVSATILALFPLALEGGPLWKPLCYAQIGGLAVATFITLLLVPVFYSIFVLDLKWIKWETTDDRQQAPEAEPTTT